MGGNQKLISYGKVHCSTFLIVFPRSSFISALIFKDILTRINVAFALLTFYYSNNLLRYIKQNRGKLHNRQVLRYQIKLEIQN